MERMYAFVVFLHVIGAFAFVAAHGVSMLTSFQLRGERDRARQGALLELSQLGAGVMYIGLLLLLVAASLQASWATTGREAGSGRRSARSSSCSW
jgi:hypothetical protein